MTEPNWMDDVLVKVRKQTPEESRRSLIESGILNEDGSPSEKYRTSEEELAKIRRGPKVLLTVVGTEWILADRRPDGRSMFGCHTVYYPLELFEDDPFDLDPDFFEEV